jgi:hypothetical protein
MRAEDLLDRLEDRPFKAFRVHLSDETLLDIASPGLVIVGRSSVVLPSRYGRDEEGWPVVRHWRTVALMHIVQFSDLDEPSAGRRRRRG